MFWAGFATGAGVVAVLAVIAGYIVNKRLRLLISLMLGHGPKKKNKL